MEHLYKKSKLKKFLLHYFFLSVDEYFQEKYNEYDVNRRMQ
jgi:hypothetical protein